MSMHVDCSNAPAANDDLASWRPVLAPCLIDQRASDKRDAGKAAASLCGWSSCKPSQTSDFIGQDNHIHSCELPSRRPHRSESIDVERAGPRCWIDRNILAVLQNCGRTSLLCGSEASVC